MIRMADCFPATITEYRAKAARISPCKALPKTELQVCSTVWGCHFLLGFKVQAQIFLGCTLVLVQQLIAWCVLKHTPQAAVSTHAATAYIIHTLF